MRRRLIFCFDFSVCTSPRTSDRQNFFVDLLEIINNEVKQMCQVSLAHNVPNSASNTAKFADFFKILSFEILHVFLAGRYG